MEPLESLTPESCERESAAYAAANPSTTPLIALIEEARFDEALLLVERGLYIDGLNARRESALLAAIRHGAPSRLARSGAKTGAQALVTSLLDHGALLHGDFWVYSLLGGWYLDEEAALELIRLLVRRCGVAGTFQDGETLLHVAAEACLPSVVEFLVDAGIDPDAEGRDGQTPAQVAAAHGFYRLDAIDRCLKALSAKKGTRPRAKDNLFGRLLGHCRLQEPVAGDGTALTQQLLAVFRTILARGEQPCHKDAKGRLPMDCFLEAMERSAATLDAQAYPTHMQTMADQAFARDVTLWLMENDGLSPNMLPLAAHAHLALLLEALLPRLQPPPNATYGRAKNTLLHEALRREEFSGEMTARTLRCLLAYGVDPHAPNGRKKSALDLYATAKRTLRPAWRKTIDAALAGVTAPVSSATAKKQASKKSGGLRFPCAGLHLAVMGALRDQKLLKLSLDKALKGVDPEGEEEARVAEAVGLLHQLPLDPGAVAKLQKLSFDGGHDIYADLEDALDVSTGGEIEAYGLQSLEGIEALATLTELSLDGHGYSPEALDLSPLAGHPALTSLSLSGTYAGTQALESIGTLKRVRGLGDAEARRRLEARGVDVS